MVEIKTTGDIDADMDAVFGIGDLIDASTRGDSIKSDDDVTVSLEADFCSSVKTGLTSTASSITIGSSSTTALRLLPSFEALLSITFISTSLLSSSSSNSMIKFSLNFVACFDLPAFSVTISSSSVSSSIISVAIMLLLIRIDPRRGVVGSTLILDALVFNDFGVPCSANRDEARRAGGGGELSSDAILITLLRVLRRAGVILAGVFLAGDSAAVSESKRELRRAGVDG